MIAPFLLLAAQAAPLAAQGAQRDCVRAVGSEIAICGTPPQQEAAQPQAQQQPVTYRLPNLRPRSYGPGLPSAQTNLGNGVRATVRGQASNAGRGRRNKPVATVSVPF